MVKEPYALEHRQDIAKLVKLDQIDYIVMSHTEPDHSGSLAEFLDAAPNATVVASRAAHNFLPEITNRPYKSMVVNDGDQIDLGGVTLEFIMAPFLHWPDTMFTYVREAKTLISGDMFGCHYCPEGVFDEQACPELIEAQKFYFDVIISPFKDYALKAIDKISGLKIEAICPSHGPVLLNKPMDTVKRFSEWSQDILVKNDPKKVVITYVSAYGYTRTLAERARSLVREAGLSVELYETTSYNVEELKAKIDAADALLIGCPTFNRDALPPVWELLISLSAFRQRNMPASAFGSFGWSGEAVPMILERMRSLGMKVQDEGFKTRFKPSDPALRQFDDYIRGFVDKVKETK